jgi:hypothetical protein
VFLLVVALQAAAGQQGGPAPAVVTEERLPAWLAAERPRLRSVELRGLQHTRDWVVRRELTLREGEAFDVRRVRETRQRLEETRVFEGIGLQAVPGPPGEAVLQIDLDERHGFGNLWNVLARGAVEAFRQKARVRYGNVAGRGVNLLAEYKWERTQPSLAVSMHAPRPFGLPANVEVVARRGRPQYDLEDDGTDPFTLRTRGIELDLRRVVAAGTLLELGGDVRDRRFSTGGPQGVDGIDAAVHGRVEQRVLDSVRRRMVVSLRVFRAARALGGDLDYTKAIAGISCRAWSSGHGQEPIAASEIAAQVRWGDGSATTPLDDMFAPGAASEMEYPLRAHRQKRDGILGRAPIGRRMALVNVEVRRRLLAADTFSAGVVAFYDVAHTARSPQGAARTLQDVGVGVRTQGRGSSLLRLDFSHSLSDGKNALTAGIGHAF